MSSKKAKQPSRHIVPSSKNMPSAKKAKQSPHHVVPSGKNEDDVLYYRPEDILSGKALKLKLLPSDGIPLFHSN